LEVHKEEPFLRHDHSTQYFAPDGAQPDVYFSGADVHCWIDGQQLAQYPRGGTRVPVRLHSAKGGHLGLGLQFDLFDTTAKINVAAQTTGDGVHHNAVSASGSLLAPIPVAGPDFRFYVTDSPRVFVQGNVLGMYLFGYGNFVSTVGNVGITLSKHFAVLAGYQLGSHLVVNNNSSSNRVGLRLVQKGAIVGLETSF
jgi:hypothetical protein